MALATQKLKRRRYNAKIDPGPRDLYLIIGVFLVIVAVALDPVALPREQKNFLIGITTTTLLTLFALELARLYFPRLVHKAVAFLSIAAIVALAALGLLSFPYKWEKPAEQVEVAIFHAAFLAYWSFVFRCNRKFRPSDNKSTKRGYGT